MASGEKRLTWRATSACASIWWTGTYMRLCAATKSRAARTPTYAICPNILIATVFAVRETTYTCQYMFQGIDPGIITTCSSARNCPGGSPLLAAYAWLIQHVRNVSKSTSPSVM